MPYVGIGAQKDSKNSLLGTSMLKVYGIVVLTIFLTLAIAGLGKHHSLHPSIQPKLETVSDIHDTISNVLISNINPENIINNLRRFTKFPHIAGTDANKKVADDIIQLWNDIGLEDVHMNSYDVLLSHPDFTTPNTITIEDAKGKQLFKSTGISPVIIPSEQSSKIAGHQWLAYSASGKVSGDVVYCNRGLPQDFENLKRMNISLKAKIALMRFGEGFRGDKVRRAQENGAIGAIIFSDPDDVARNGIDPGDVYPNTVWMPNEAVQRGSILHGNGDPLSPLYPSRPELFKSLTVEQARREGIIPKIPAMPISYTTAYQILSRLKGRPVPQPWQDKLLILFVVVDHLNLHLWCLSAINVTYRTGPGFQQGDKLTMDVHGKLKIKQVVLWIFFIDHLLKIMEHRFLSRSQLFCRKIRNIIGYIRGKDEPDRYVILGNHYDAWVYGSIDPNSGTAILTEVANAMMHTINKTGWRPARTIMFTAWDGEEHGIIGSTEFVEEFTDILRQRAVIYLNMDCLHGNSSFYARSIPSLHRTLVEVTKRIPNPSKSEREKGRHTLYDTWLKTFPSSIQEQPDIPIPGAGSDHVAFLTYAGVPVVDFTFKNVTTYDTYPLYHTMYETPFLNEHLFDTDGFAVHKAVGQFWAEIARVFTDEVVLPFNSTELAAAILLDYIPKLGEALAPLKFFHSAIHPAVQQLAYMTKAAQEFLHLSRKFERIMYFTYNAFSQNPFDSRHIMAVNERLMKSKRFRTNSIHRCFINPRGNTNAPQSRHVLYSVSEQDSYSSRQMAAVYDAISTFSKADTEEQRIKLGATIAYQMSIVQYSIYCSSNTLKDLI
ncbi:PA domain protein [Dictyocaulus viviparus]|uniref:PA domain protein n=1 Tax=Dictyocaulus viviparus TaxID=29172 RepID=A0A0D8XHR1_DICVI|nr:PA domain protein [Dictyocaulus viviparus]